MSCPKNNGGTHSFYPTVAEKSDEFRIDDHQEFSISTWHTCIGCGERRAITIWGELIEKIEGKWKVIEP